MLTALALAAAVAGSTGSWSPCGMSMIATLGPTGHTGGARRTAAACAAFACGALAGGVVTFGALGLAGSLLPSAGATTAAAVAILVVAALLDARGAPIAPQIRRQVPEPWRRVAGLPLAALGYGVLLGMGFTTYVLSYALPALAAVCLVAGDPVTGIVVGLAFGAGRALPVVVLAPLAGRSPGVRAGELMMEHPGTLRGLRAAGTAALMLCAVIVAGAGGAA